MVGKTRLFWDNGEKFVFDWGVGKSQYLQADGKNLLISSRRVHQVSDQLDRGSVNDRRCI